MGNFFFRIFEAYRLANQYFEERRLNRREQEEAQAREAAAAQELRRSVSQVIFSILMS
jgi:hypothetical protein